MFDAITTQNLATALAAVKAARAARAEAGETQVERDAASIRDGIKAQVDALWPAPVADDFASAAEWRNAADQHTFTASKLRTRLANAEADATRLREDRERRESATAATLAEAEAAWRRAVAHAHRDQALAAFETMVAATVAFQTINSTFEGDFIEWPRVLVFQHIMQGQPIATVGGARTVDTSKKASVADVLREAEAMLPANDTGGRRVRTAA